MAAIAAERGVPLHVDAVQAAASLPIDFAACGAETMALSAHKLRGPKGVGALVARDPARLRPLIWGGGQEGGRARAPRTWPASSASRPALEAMRARGDRRRALRDRLEAALAPEHAGRLGRGAERLPGHSLILVAGRARRAAGAGARSRRFRRLGRLGLRQRRREPSHVLLAQGLAPTTPAA